jgi:predicted N-acetyltransferase YhbS
MSFITVPLDSSHNKENFSCGKPLLDAYLQKQAKQDVKRRLSACFILPDGNGIKGYCTFSYSDLPAILLGRLAVDKSYQGQGLGELILMDAIKRSYFTSMQVGSMAVIVDPLDDEAVKFYGKYDFILLPDSGKMFLPMETIAQLFAEG